MSWRPKQSLSSIALSVLGVLLWTGGALGAQAFSVPGVTSPGSEDSGSTERFPTPRDPRYIPPFVPEYLKRKLDPSAGLLIAPGGEANIELLRKSQEDQAQRRRQKLDRYRIRDFSDSATTPQDRGIFEAMVLRQFGIDTYAFARGADHYSETPARRFQVVFSVSLPITMAFSYGLVMASKGRLGQKPVLDGNETLALAAGGVLMSAGIAWYDLVQWRKLDKQGNSFNHRAEPDRPARLLAELHWSNTDTLGNLAQRERRVGFGHTLRF